MKRLLFLVASLVLAFAVVPIQARQSTTDIPDLTSQAVNGAVSAISSKQDAFELGVLILLIIIAYVALRPLINNSASANQRADAAHLQAEDANKRASDAHQTFVDHVKEEDERRKSDMGLRQQQADTLVKSSEIQERTANIVSNLESKQEAVASREAQAKAFQERSDGNTAKIIQYTDDSVKQAVAPIGEGIGDIKDGLEALIKKLDDVATRDQLQEVISPISNGLHAVVERVGDLEATIQGMIDSKRDLPVLKNPPPPESQP